MRIIFVRHGESEFNADPVKENDNKGLTKKGREQAKYLGMKLKGQNVSKIYTSTLLRAKQTGEIISKITKVPIENNFQELDEYPADILRSLTRRLFYRRLKKLKSLLGNFLKSRKKDETILIVAHGITNRIIMGYLLKIPIKRQLLFFRQHNTCVNSVAWNEEFKSWHMDKMNDISHLPKNLVLE